MGFNDEWLSSILMFEKACLCWYNTYIHKYIHTTIVFPCNADLPVTIFATPL